MRILLHIGLEAAGSGLIQTALEAKRDHLIGKGVLFARTPGGRNHTRLFMAVTDPDHVDPLRFNLGYISEENQRVLRETLSKNLAREVEQNSPHTLILSAHQLASSLSSLTELERLKSLLSPLSEDISIIAHVDEQGRALARHYADQVMEGRATGLDVELGLADTKSWWQSCLDLAPSIAPAKGVFAETQAPPFWLDYAMLVAHWDSVFGAGSTQLRAYEPELFHSADATQELREAFGINDSIGKVTPNPVEAQPSAAWLTRGRMLNDLLLRVLQSDKRVLSRPLWRKFMNEISVQGDAIEAGSLSPISKAFEKGNKALSKAHNLNATCLKRDRARPDWQEADPTLGFRASQYLTAFLWRIDKATQEARKGLPNPTDDASDDGLTPQARQMMPPLAVQNLEKLRASSFAPHNRMGSVNEEDLAAAYTQIEPRKLPKGSSGNVIVGCMKNEAPYIVEWVAYHRAMGVDNFLIYTNDCSDGTTEILDRLQELGILEHRNNDKWKGNSPQQHALNSALNEPVIKKADWIIHIDVDEFMNVRTGNGTLQDFLAVVPDATNVAMTWRMFGHNGVTKLSTNFVIDQFDTCAPKFCPKPHTVWGFKTMFRNIGAYEKISCHRPNKLDPSFKNKVKWVNGSGKDMTREVAENGWRNSKKSIGYDLLQLNHYALRSAESFLIKRQRGRALHVDRSIGLNYWIRMDWSDFRDITIKRNIPRLQAEFDRLMQDKTLAKWHDKGVKWHLAKAEELHAMPEFAELYEEALKVKLTETERVAYALALDMET